MNPLLSLASDPGAWLALATLVVMEVVLGIDNLVFVAIARGPKPDLYTVEVSLAYRMLFWDGRRARDREHRDHQRVPLRSRHGPVP